MSHVLDNLDYALSRNSSLRVLCNFSKALVLSNYCISINCIASSYIIYKNTLIDPTNSTYFPALCQTGHHWNKRYNYFWEESRSIYPAAGLVPLECSVTTTSNPKLVPTRIQ